jgi:hypothetical protein
MADNKEPSQGALSSLLIDPSKAPLYGEGSDEYLQTVQKAQEDAVKALQDRYANPNLFKVAAAFGKPQLGGFAASLGSAFDVLGENVEQERAQQMPIQALKIQMAQTGALMKVNKTVNDEIQEWEKNNKGPVPLDKLQNWYARAPNSQGVKSLTEKYGFTKSDLDITKAGKELQYTYPELNRSVLNVLPETPEEFNKQMVLLNKAKPDQYSLDEWNSLTPEQKKDYSAKAIDEKRHLVMNEEQKSADIANGSLTRLQLLVTARDLASDPEMAPVFAVLNKADAMSLVKKITDEVGGNTGAVMQGLQNAIRSQYTNENDPDGTKRAKADLLFKTIARIASENRNSAENPTNAWQELSKAGTPGIENSQQGFLSIIDLMGLAEQKNIDLHNLRMGLHLPSSQILSGGERQALERKYREEAEHLTKTNPYSREPSWYKGTTVTIPPDAKMQKPAEPPAPVVPAEVSATSQAPRSSPSAPRSSFSDAVRKSLKKD